MRCASLHQSSHQRGLAADPCPTENSAVLRLVGTLCPVSTLRLASERRDLAEAFTTLNVTSGQHKELLHPFVRLFEIRVDHDLAVMTQHQTPSHVCSRVLAALDPLLAEEMPDLILVQGDTTTTFCGALGAFYRGLPVAHVEAGLRTGDLRQPFPCGRLLAS